jgi:hypothetical protein
MFCSGRARRTIATIAKLRTLRDVYKLQKSLNKISSSLTWNLPPLDEAGRAILDSIVPNCWSFTLLHSLLALLLFSIVKHPFLLSSTMFAKLFFALTFLLSISLQVSAHALITPAIGVSGKGARSDVQRPSAAKPCGNANIAQTLGSSTTAQLSAQDTFTATITNFNA